MPRRARDQFRQLPPRLAMQIEALKHAGRVDDEQCPLQEGGKLAESDARKLLQVISLLTLPPSEQGQAPYHNTLHDECLVSSKPDKYREEQGCGCLSRRDMRTYPAWLHGAEVCTRREGRWHFGLGVSSLTREQWAAFGKFKVEAVRGRQRNVKQTVMDARDGSNHTVGVNIILCWLFHGEPPRGKPFACHFFCGRHFCLNPKHISWGDHADNAYHKVWHKEHRPQQNLGEMGYDLSPAKLVPAAYEPPYMLSDVRPSRLKKISRRQGPLFGKPLV